MGAIDRALSRFYTASNNGAFDINGNQLAVITVANSGTGNTKLLHSFTDSRGKKASDMLVDVHPRNDSGQNLEAAIEILFQFQNNASLGYRSGAQNPNVRHLAIYATLNGGWEKSHACYYLNLDKQKDPTLLMPFIV